MRLSCRNVTCIPRLDPLLRVAGSASHGLVCVIALLCTVACTLPPAADRPLGEADFERWSVHVLTWDADGDRRKTRVWMVAIEGTPYVRTGQTRWWQNIERGSETQILSGGDAYPVTIEPVVAASLRAEIDAAFATKYGWLGRLVIDAERAQSDDPYLRLIPITQEGGPDSVPRGTQ
ncbi:MAG: DUF2255 family protein [bacterium]|nr:DUF2255 family protein [bacterium]